MNTDLAAVSLRSARIPSVSSFFPRSRSGERRFKPRRDTDRQRALLAWLAGWFANRQAQPLFIVDGRMTVLLLNDAAHRFLSHTKALRINGGKLAFRTDRHRVDINRVLKKEAASISLPMKIAGPTASVSVS